MPRGRQEAAHQVTADTEDSAPAAGTPTNILVSLVIIALGIATLAGSLSLGIGTARKPGSGTWPFLVSVVLVVLGVALALLSGRIRDAERFSRSSLIVLAGLATTVVFAGVIEVVGFEIPATLLAFVWLRFLGHETWRSSVVISLATVVTFYILFVAVLQVPVPHLF
jgi:putative tricarboxylic transport membrane protein